MTLTFDPLTLNFCGRSGSSGLGPKIGPGILYLGQPTQIIWTTVLLLIRPPDIDMSEGLRFYCCNFSTYTTTPCSGCPSNVYHRFGRRIYWILHLSILATPPLILQRVKKCEIWLRSSTLLFFERPSFRNESAHSYQSEVSYLVHRRWNSAVSKSGAVWPASSDMSTVWKSPPWKKWLNRQ